MCVKGGEQPVVQAVIHLFSVCSAIAILKNDCCSTEFDSRFYLGIVQEFPFFVTVTTFQLITAGERERKGTLLQMCGNS
ncbi:hypothetical protein BS17DRAFT_773321 [Gyrodon lividus]|nr:hypothetical protein BS17DRAFT_773321 [Gyrodon lividus]